MKKTLLITCFMFSTLISFSQEKTTQEKKEVTSYFLIRHAEKVRSNADDKDPDLNYEGLKRAMKWTEVFKDVKFDAIYSTNYRRTKQTVQPIANHKKINVYLYNPKDMYNDIFKNNTQGKTILIVGHSNTTPLFANKILGEEKYEQIDDKENNNLYIVTVTEDSKSAVLLKVD